MPKGWRTIEVSSTLVPGQRLTRSPGLSTGTAKLRWKPADKNFKLRRQSEKSQKNQSSQSSQDKVPERREQAKAHSEDTGNLDSTLAIRENEFTVKSLPTKKTTGPDGFIGEYQVYTNSSRKLKEMETSKLILCGQYYPDTKTRQTHSKKRQLQSNSPYEYR